MKNLFLLLLFLPGISSMGGVPVKTEVKEVMVYTSGARIVSTGEAVLQKGQQELVLSRISPFLDESSIQFRGNADFTVLSISVAGKAGEQAVQDQGLKKLEDSLTYCRGKINQIQNQQTALQEEMAMLRANQKLGSSAQGLMVTELEKAASFFRNRMEEILNRQYEAEQIKGRWQNRINALELAIQDYRGETRTGSSTIIVLLKSNHSGSAAFELSYLVSNAGWTPQYDIRARENAASTEILARARVWQNTGENWKDVKISLSTGNPGASQEIPGLSPLYLQLRAPERRTALMKNKRGRGVPSAYESMAPAAYKAEEKSAVMDMEMQSGDASSFTENNENGGQNIFETSLPYSIKSDGKPVLVDIQKFEIPAEFQYIVRPKLEKAAFLEARLNDWARSGLQPGEASLFLDGNYTGKTFFETSLTSDTLSLSFGKDQNISVERKQLRYYQDKNLTGADKIIELAFEISIKNRKKSDISLRIEDQIPLSPLAGAEVELTESGGAELDKEKGFLRWKRKLRGGEGLSLRFAYKIRYPKGMDLMPGF